LSSPSVKWAMARRPGLIGEEEHEIAGVVQPPDRLGGVSAIQLILSRVADMARRPWLTTPVAVEEGGGAFCTALPEAKAAHFLLRPRAACSCSIFVADAVGKGHIDLLNDRRVVARRDQHVIAGGTQSLRPCCR